jgi:UDP-N-acetylmuramoyl-L-alanyl-D-glutamate--2,6-diaminopimelate ligase
MLDSRAPHGDVPSPGQHRTPTTMVSPHPLDSLVAPLGGVVTGDGNPLVEDVVYRTADVTAGALFCAVRGTRVDGHDFAPQAVAAGAVAVLAERRLDLPVPQVLVPSVREAMGPVAAELFGHPARELTMAGVTGTNGKTTTTYLLESIFRAAGLAPGVIGTTGVRLDGRPAPLDRTTPEAPDLHRLLRRMAEEGVRAVAMEVSSHGLEQHRVGGVRFDVAVFTNLSQDHLDYHGTLERYLAAKARLFTPELAERAAVNADDEAGRTLAGRGLPTITYAIDTQADIRATDVHVTAEGVSFRAGDLEVTSRLRGRFSVYNCLAAVAAARQLGIEDGAIAQGIAALPGVPGRIEPVEAGQEFLVLVDYAHTPDSVENVLAAARALAARRLIVVLGCGGDRDRGKRPLMGEAATRAADLTVVTSDNPRSEDPLAIIAEIEPGARRGGGEFVVEPDRRVAIRLALARAGAGDVVVIAGKGHESGQEFADRTIPFDDRTVAREELGALAEEAP